MSLAFQAIMSVLWPYSTVQRHARFRNYKLLMGNECE